MPFAQGLVELSGDIAGDAGAKRNGKCVDAFPVAPTGKVLKHKLVSHFAHLLQARDADATHRKDPAL